MVNDHMKYKYTILTDEGQWYGYNELKTVQENFEFLDKTQPILFFEVGMFVPKIHVIEDILNIIE